MFDPHKSMVFEPSGSELVCILLRMQAREYHKK